MAVAVAVMAKAAGRLAGVDSRVERARGGEAAVATPAAARAVERAAVTVAAARVVVERAVARVAAARVVGATVVGGMVVVEREEAAMVAVKEGAA